MRINSAKRRRAISPVLATVILIAITLIAAIAIAGFVFGLFGTFTSTARVQASVTSCSWTSPSETCNLILTNTGNANTFATASCSITTKGATTTGAYAFAAPSTSLSVPSAGTNTGTCTATIGDPGAGVQITGSVILANGGNALFSATSSN